MVIVLIGVAGAVGTPRLGLLALRRIVGAPKVPVAFPSTLLGPCGANRPVPSEALVDALEGPPPRPVRSDEPPQGEAFADLDLQGG